MTRRLRVPDAELYPHSNVNVSSFIHVHGPGVDNAPSDRINFFHSNVPRSGKRRTRKVPTRNSLCCVCVDVYE